MGTTVTAPPEAEGGETLGFFGRLAGVFISPGETFADIARKPDFIAPLILSIVAAIAYTESMLAKIGMERMMQTAMQQSKQQVTLTPEQMQQQVKIGTIFTHIAGALGSPIFLIIVAALGLLFINAFFGAKAGFKTAFSVACYASMVSLISTGMSIAMVFFGDPEHFNPQNPVPTNPGFFMNPLESSKPLLALAGSIDIFSFWLMALFGIGFSHASGRKAKSLSVFFCFFGVWLVYILGKVGLAMLR